MLRVPSKCQKEQWYSPLTRLLFQFPMHGCYFVRRVSEVLPLDLIRMNQFSRFVLRYSNKNPSKNSGKKKRERQLRTNRVEVILRFLIVP